MTRVRELGRRAAAAALPWTGIIAGALIAAYGYAALIMPNHLMEGGVTGVGFLVHHLFGLPAGLTGLVLTAMAFVFGLKILGRGFGLKGVVGVVVASLGLDLFYEVLEVAPLTDDPVLAAVSGGAMCGLGLGMVYVQGGATGGTDTIAQVLLKLMQTPVSRTLLTVDILVMGAALPVYGAEPILYSLLMVAVEIKVIDLVMRGKHTAQRALIISDHSRALRSRLMEGLDRGVTAFPSQGGWSGVQRDVLSVVVARRQVSTLRQIVAEVDPDAFVVVEDVKMAWGRGFDRLTPPRMSKRPA